MATPKLLDLVANVEGVVACRPFADRGGALVVTTRQVVLVELDGPKMSEPVATWLYDVGRALSYLPVTTTVVRSEADVERLAAEVAGSVTTAVVTEPRRRAPATSGPTSPQPPGTSAWWPRRVSR